MNNTNIDKNRCDGLHDLIFYYDLKYTLLYLAINNLFRTNRLFDTRGIPKLQDNSIRYEKLYKHHIMCRMYAEC